MPAYYFYGIAATVFMVSCWSFAAIRWLHTCDAPKHRWSYVWPDRKLQVLLELLSTALLPYIFDPTSPSAWLMEKCWLPTCGYLYIAVILLCFFGRVQLWNRWHSVSIVASGIVILTMLPIVVNAWMGGTLIPQQYYLIIIAIVTVVSFLMMSFAFMAMWQVGHWMKETRDNIYSNPTDFPLPLAQRVWFAPLIFTPLYWPAFIFDSPLAMAIQNLLMGFMNIALLIIVLPAWRRKIIIPDGDEPEPDNSRDDLPPERIETIAQRIEDFVSKRQGYLDEHLRIENVVTECGYNRNYISRVFKERYGGFYTYVNKLRLEHFEQFIRQHPEVTKEAAAHASGFSSYQAYYRAKERLT